MKSTFENHSVSTLAKRFRGLVCRNTLTAWLQNGKLVPVMTGRNGTFLFRIDYLDSVTRLLERSHQQRVERLIRKKDAATRIREEARKKAEAVMMHNDSAEFSRRPDLKKRELSPALDDFDAVGVDPKLNYYKLQSNCGLYENRKVKK